MEWLYQYWHQLVVLVGSTWGWFHHVLHPLVGLVDSNWAYLILFVWTVLEGETILIIAGACAQDGRPDIALCILAAFAGSLFGDQMWFYIGRHKGTRLLRRRPAWHAKANKVFGYLEAHNTLLILGFRFLYGLRNITPFAIGMSKVSNMRFLALNAIGAAVWATAFGMAGYIFGKATTSFMETHKKHVVTAMLAAALVYWLVRAIVRRRRAAKLKLLASEDLPTQGPDSV